MTTASKPIDDFRPAIIFDRGISLNDENDWEDALIYMNEEGYCVIQARDSGYMILQFTHEQLIGLLNMFKWPQ